MKLFLRMFYIFILIMIGTNVYNNSIIEKEENFFLNETVTSIKDNDKNLYLNNTMVFLGADEYLKKPIYKYKAEKEGTEFEFEIYHFKINEKKNQLHGLAFYLNNIKLKEELNDLKIVLYSESSNQFLEEEISFEFKKEKFNSNLIYSMILKEKFYDFENNKFINEIKTIDIKQKDKVIARIDHDNEFVLNENTEINLKDNNLYLNTNKFNGNIENYNFLKEKYGNEEKVVLVNYKTFDTYQKVVTKNIINYSIVAVVGSALVFLMEPFIKFIKRKKKVK